MDFAILICLNIQELNLIERILTNKGEFQEAEEQDIEDNEWNNSITKDAEVTEILNSIVEL